MTGISRLYCGAIQASDALRYGPDHAAAASGSTAIKGRKPVVVWNCTSRCNLACKHCYSASDANRQCDEMSTAQAMAMIDDLAAFGIPVLLFSGGEPLVREDLPALVARASQAGIRTVVSTNGTLITPSLASLLADAGIAYAGVSIDGLQEANDSFRGRRGAFADAMRGIANCQAAGIKVGLRLTMNSHNLADIPAIFDLIDANNIPRVCFYHLVQAGRGAGLQDATPTKTEMRNAVDTIIDRTAALHNCGKGVEVLTVDNHADSAYLYQRMCRENHPGAAECLRLLQRTGGNSSGSGIGCISWNGDIMPDQFWRQHVVGNVLSSPFSEVWSDENQEMLAKLRNRSEHLPARCRACRWLGICNGNLRARAEAATGDPWGFDPGCYLTDEEIA